MDFFDRSGDVSERSKRKAEDAELKKHRDTENALKKAQKRDLKIGRLADQTRVVKAKTTLRKAKLEDLRAKRRVRKFKAKPLKMLPKKKKQGRRLTRKRPIGII